MYACALVACLKEKTYGVDSWIRQKKKKESWSKKKHCVLSYFFFLSLYYNKCHSFLFLFHIEVKSSKKKKKKKEISYSLQCMFIWSFNQFLHTDDGLYILDFIPENGCLSIAY
jgi:hypothetical protein